MKHKLLRIVAVVLALLFLVPALLFVWTKVEYGPSPLLPHQRITITLPFSKQNEATNMVPMGETIAHPIPGGHPGIDFQWQYAAPLIAVADGTISSITDAQDMGAPVKYLELTSGQYVARYKELDAVWSGVQVGSRVRQGDKIAFPHCVEQTEGKHCQLHFEFAYSWPLMFLNGPKDRLCPLTYFDQAALRRITAIWNSVSPNDKFKSQFPHICNNVFNGLDQ